MNQNLVGSTCGRFCIKFPQSTMKGERYRLSPLSLYFLFADINFDIYSIRTSTSIHSQICPDVIERDVNSFIPFMVKNETYFRLSLLHPYLTLQKADLNMIFVIKYIIYFLPTDQIGSSKKI